MQFTLENTILIVVVALTGLTAGLCFTWYNAVTPGIGRLNDLDFLQSFQAMNRAIINPLFLLVFFGPFIGHILNVYLHRNANPTNFWLFLAAAVLFILGVVLVTIFRNVPLNELLDKTDLLAASGTDLAQLRERFEKPWNQWHLIRTITSFASLLLLLLGALVFQK